MVLYVVLIATIKVLDMKMIYECPIVAKGKLILELSVSELGAIDRRDNKEAAN